MKSEKELSRELVADRVLNFYESLPFNLRDSVESSIENLKRHDPVRSYPPLKGLVKGKTVLEVGCGVGWFSNGLAYHHKAHVTGIDFNPVAIVRASEVAMASGTSARFEVADVFQYLPNERADVVVSLGVLHHTGDCHGAIRRICDQFLAPDGYFLLGLYHTYGRRPFLDHFESMKQREATEEEMYQEFKRLRGGGSDETHLRSWFRDQVIHPHETQHSFEEIYALLEECQMEIISTSINKFEKIKSIKSIIDSEKTYYDYSKKQLDEGIYFPGFFVILARHVGR